MKEGAGTKIFVYGLLSILCCGLFGFVAYIEGTNRLQAKDYPEREHGLIVAGQIMGLIGIIMFCCAGGLVNMQGGLDQSPSPYRGY